MEVFHRKIETRRGGHCAATPRDQRHRRRRRMGNRFREGRIVKTIIRRTVAESHQEARESAEREARRLFTVSRQQRGWSQLRASTELGVGASTLADWERGAARVPAWALVAIRKGIAA